MGFFQSHPSFSGAQTSQAPEFPIFQRQFHQMPERPPSLMNQLAQSLGGGLGEGVAGGIKQQFRNAVLEKALSRVQPNMSPLEKAQVLATAGPEAEPYIRSIYDAEAAAAKEQREREFEREKIRLQGEEKLKQIQAKPVKGQIAPEQAANEKKLAQNHFNKQVDLLNQGRLGSSLSALTHGGIFNRSRQKDIGKFNSVNAYFEGELRKIINPTGTMSDKRFKYIVDDILPNAYLSDKENQGRLEGLAEILGLDASKLTSKENSLTPAPPGFIRFTNPQTGETRDIMESKAEEARTAGWVNE